MLFCRCKWVLLGWFAAFLLAAPGACACSVPVFRYALERWPADAYELVVFHREPLTTNQQALVDAWKQAGEKNLVNMGVSVVNLAGKISEKQQNLWKAQKNAVPPWIVVSYPAQKEIEMPVWAGTLNSDAVKTLVDSPARREIARRLCKGDSTVWVLLESGDEKRDDEVAALFEKESRNLEKSLKLPEPEAEGPQVQSEVPLKIAFSLVRVSRNNPAEHMFREMLLRIDSELPKVTEPIVFAVFGRGRALPMPFGKNLQAEVIREAAEFLTSACSCEVKTMNPGVDLLVAADWEGSLEGRVVKDPELPPLIGMGQFASASVTNLVVGSVTTNQVIAFGYDFTHPLGFLLLGGLVVVGIMTIVIKFTRGRS